MNDITRTIDKFERGELAFNYRKATQDEMENLGELLNGLTERRPHGGLSYAKHMQYYQPKGFAFLTVNHLEACSYRYDFGTGSFDEVIDATTAIELLSGEKTYREIGNEIESVFE